jgi:hypothetical protein
VLHGGRITSDEGEARRVLRAVRQDRLDGHVPAWPGVGHEVPA